jgi:hypothetical protein
MRELPLTMRHALNWRTRPALLLPLGGAFFHPPLGWHTLCPERVARAYEEHTQLKYYGIRLRGPSHGRRVALLWQGMSPCAAPTSGLVWLARAALIEEPRVWSVRLPSHC